MSAIDAVTVVVPCHNCGRELDQTLATALSQTRAVSHVVLVDEGSNRPATHQMLDRMVGGRVSVSGLPVGASTTAHDAGTAEADTALVLWLEAGHLLQPTFLETALRCFGGQPELDFLASGVSWGSAPESRWLPPSRRDFAERWTLAFPAAPVLFRRTAWHAIGPADRALRPLGAWELWMRAGAAGRGVAGLASPLTAYHPAYDAAPGLGEGNEFEAALARWVDTHCDELRQNGATVLGRGAAALAALRNRATALESRRAALAESSRTLAVAVESTAPRDRSGLV